MDELIFLHSPFLVCVCVCVWGGGGGVIKAVTTVVPLQKVKLCRQIVFRSHLIPNLISPKFLEEITQLK